MGSRKRNKATEIKELNKNKVFAKLNNCPTSPRKMRLVASQLTIVASSTLSPIFGNVKYG